MTVKVAKNTIFRDELSHIQTLHIPLRDLKPSLRKEIELEGLYALERVFGVECDGHGVGFGGEDITFTLPSPHKMNPCRHPFVFEISLVKNKLEISERLYLFTHKDLPDGDSVRLDDYHDFETTTISPRLVRILKRALIKRT